MSRDWPIQPCGVVRHHHDDLDVVVVSNDEIRLGFLPQLGGRLGSCHFRGTEVLWRNPDLLDDDLAPRRPLRSWPSPDGTMASWTNPGGNKTWPAPQGWQTVDEWHGPPDPVLDSGPYTLTSTLDEAGAATVELVSAIDPVTGIKIIRRFVLPATGTTFEQVSTFRNCSSRPVTWAVWDVTQVDTAAEHGADGVVSVESVGEPGAVEHLFALDGLVSYDRGPRSWTIPSQDVVGKLGFPGATGKLEYRRRDGVTLELATTRQSGAYPDGGCPVELWLQHPLPGVVPELGGLRVSAHLIELEVLSPLHRMRPGETTTLETSWRLGSSEHEDGSGD